MRQAGEPPTERLSVAVMGIEPAAGKRFSGWEDQIPFCEEVDILLFLSGLAAAMDVAGQRVEQLVEIGDFDQVFGPFVLEEHVTGNLVF